MTIERKLKEMKSRWMAGEPVYSKNKHIESFCLFVSRWHYKLTTKLYYDIKYFFQRLFRGYDDLDKWNAAWYISRKAIPVLQAWRNSRMMGTSIKRHYINRHGEIVEYKDEDLRNNNNEIPDAFSEEEWKMIIDDIIFAFQWQIDFDSPDGSVNDRELKAGDKRQSRGLELFSIYYRNLWD